MEGLTQDHQQQPTPEELEALVEESGAPTWEDAILQTTALTWEQKARELHRLAVADRQARERLCDRLDRPADRLREQANTATQAGDDLSALADALDTVTL
jgi:hypothetical protein